MLHSEHRLLGPCAPLEQEYTVREVYSEEAGDSVVYIEEINDSPTQFSEARSSLDSGSDRSLAADLEFAEYLSNFLNSDAIEVLSPKEKLLFTSLLDSGRLSEAMNMVQRLVAPGEDDDVSSEDVSSLDDDEEAEFMEQAWSVILQGDHAKSSQVAVDDADLPPLSRTLSAPAAIDCSQSAATEPKNPFLSLKVDAPEFSFKPAAAEFVPSFLSSAPAFVPSFAESAPVFVPSFAAAPAGSSGSSKVFVDRSIPAVLLRRGGAAKSSYSVDFVWGLRQTMSAVTLDNLDYICLRAPGGSASTPTHRGKAEKLSADVDHVDSNVSSSSQNSMPKSLKKRGQDIPGFIPPSRYGGASVPTTPVPSSGRKSKGSDFSVDPSFVPPSRYGGCANPNAYKLKNLHVDTDVDAASSSPQRVQSAPASLSSSSTQPIFTPTPNRWTPNRARGEDAIVRSNLNKLTPENFDVLLPKFLEITVASLATLNSIADILFEKAVFESVFCELYVSLLVKINDGLPSFCDDGVPCPWEKEISANVNLVRLICRRCFSSFKDGATLSPIDPELLDDEIREERARKMRRKELGAFVLIGELYKIGILSADDIFSCIDASLQPLDGSYKDVEAACVLVRSCGAALDKAEADQLAAVLSRFKRLELTETSQSRLRFMVLDVVEESGKRWNSRLAKATPQKVKADVLVPLVPNSRTPIKFERSPKLGFMRSPYSEPHIGPSPSHTAHHLQQPRKH